VRDANPTCSNRKAKARCKKSIGKTLYGLAQAFCLAAWHQWSRMRNGAKFRDARCQTSRTRTTFKKALLVVTPIDRGRGVMGSANRLMQPAFS